MGDNKIEQFRATWDHYVGNLRTTANKAEELEEVLLKHLEKSAALQADIAYYRRIHQNHNDKSYGFLYRTMCREMHLQALKRNRTAEEQMRKQQTVNSLAKQPGVPAAPGAEVKKETRKAAKEKKKAAKVAAAKAKPGGEDNNNNNSNKNNQKQEPLTASKAIHHT